MYFKNNFYVYSSPQSHKHNITLKRIKNFKGKVNKMQVTTLLIKKLFPKKQLINCT